VQSPPLERGLALGLALSIKCNESDMVSLLGVKEVRQFPTCAMGKGWSHKKLNIPKVPHSPGEAMVMAELAAGNLGRRSSSPSWCHTEQTLPAASCSDQRIVKT
jgi:hypothetical protein